MENMRAVAKKRASAWSEENGNMPYFETSAKEGTGVSDAFTTLAKMALNNK